MMNMKALVRLTGFLVFALSPTVHAYDNGAQVLGCDYKFGKTEETGKCLIVGSGMGQGVSWTVFEVNGKRFRYFDSSPDKLELIDKSGNAKAKYRIKNTPGQCRPGGPAVDKYVFDNGDYVCLYWK